MPARCGLAVLVALCAATAVSGATAPAHATADGVPVVEISLGTPAQKLRCLLDTGSSDLWVPSKRCSGCSAEGRTFDADKSTTFSPQLVDGNPKPVEIAYDGSRVAGYEAQETLSLGDLKLENQTFVIVEETDLWEGLPESTEWDAVCGLGWIGLATAPAPLYAHLQEKGRDALFSLVPSADGEISFGVGEPLEGFHSAGTAAWVPAEAVAGALAGGGGGQRGFWTVRGGVAVTKEEPTEIVFEADTGAREVLLVPPQDWEALMGSLFPEGALERACHVPPESVLEEPLVCECSVAAKEMKPMRIYLGSMLFNLSFDDLFAGAPVPASGSGPELCELQVRRRQAPGRLPGLRPHPGAHGAPGQGGLLGELGDAVGHPLGDHGNASVGEPGEVHGASGHIVGLPEPLVGDGPDAPDWGSVPADGLVGELFNATEEEALNTTLDIAASLDSSARNASQQDNLTLNSDGGLLGGLLGALQGATGGSEGLGGLLGGLVGGPGTTKPKGAVQGTQVETTVKLSNGTVCRTTLVTDEDGRTQKNETECTDEPEPPAPRRLCSGCDGPPALERGAEGGSEWVLGSGFLLRHAMILDFDGARMGIAELAAEVELPPLMAAARAPAPGGGSTPGSEFIVKAQRLPPSHGARPLGGAVVTPATWGALGAALAGALALGGAAAGIRYGLWSRAHSAHLPADEAEAQLSRMEEAE